MSVHESAALHAAELAARAEAGTLSALDARSLAHAEDLMAWAREVLTEAGQLRLIGGA
ncbi:hypothetical protein ACIQPQ_31365 [Streptomyces sp. NPDC091281]|uniref:hypothetical protein n=1 Tax=Streptomyces sp. NPDC091281 TaxID=3365985 RepID=UPI00381A308F